MASMRSGAAADSIYRPNLWYYGQLQFLDDHIESRPSLSTLPPRGRSGLPCSQSSSLPCRQEQATSEEEPEFLEDPDCDPWSQYNKINNNINNSNSSNYYSFNNNKKVNMITYHLNSVPGLYALPTGQKYKVVIPQQIHALYKSDAQDQYPHVVKYELQIEDKPLVIHLERNEELVADRYMETSYDQDDRPIMISPQGNIKDHCHYQGYVENDNQSMVSISTCSGLSGLILTQGRRYLIEPQNLAEGMHVVYEEEEENPKACAVTDGHWEGSVLAQEVLPIPTQEEIDHLLNVQKFVELVVVADISMYHKYENNTESVKDRVFAIVNVMNLDYKILNISVVLVGLEIWDTKDQIEVSTIIGDTLSTFSTWRKEKLLPRIAHDNAHLITNTDFKGPVIGLGYVGAMCSEKSLGVDQC
ncbi:snake venom metalloproteinase BITM02A-like [Rana temporaria]|uniref:snake venom metalloproteinase BITM02A-like n=1 Tax=Rana temporaria TaxID=8407 RepID=UPI001AAC7E83|nr:snake venom metalloproteinase BITM02A-like [Rana temporaria]